MASIQDLISLFRKQMRDEQQPYLWDDFELLQYVVDAQDMVVRAFGGISDYSTTAITDVGVVLNTPTSAFDRSILRIRSIKLLTSNRKVEIMSESNFDRMHTHFSSSPTFMDDSDTGDVRYAVIGVEDYKLRWYKVPNLSETARMHVYRLPYPRIQYQEDALEIESQHHIHLLKWMKYMAYETLDAEGTDPELAQRNKEAFDTYCEKVRLEKERQRFKPRIIQSNY